jgi:hypothetical protein
VRFFAPVGDVVQLPRGGAFHLMIPAGSNQLIIIEKLINIVTLLNIIIIMIINATDKTITIGNDQSRKRSGEKEKKNVQ